MTNYATQYCKSLSQAYPYMLHFGALFARNQEGDYRFTNAHTIEVPTLRVTGRVDASRNSMSNLGDWEQAHSNEWTPLVLRNHRKWRDFIHPRDIDESNEVLSITRITQTMNQEEKFPEMDRYLISTLYNDWRALGRVPLTAKLTAQNVLTYFDQMMVMMTEKNVPSTGRILYITPQANLFLKSAVQMYRTELNAPATIQRAIANIDSVSVEEVPSGSMKTVYDFTIGSKVGTSAKQVQMFLVHPSAVITPEEYEFANLTAPSAVSEGKWLYFEESYNDAFILPNKQYGIEFLVSDLESSAATFSSQAGTAASGDTKVTITAPVGANVIPNTRYFYAAKAGSAVEAPAFGTLVADDAEWTEWDGKNTTVLSIPNGQHMTLLACDTDGRVYASGSATVTSKA